MPGVLEKCSGYEAQATASTASHGATATAVGVTPAKAMTSPLEPIDRMDPEDPMEATEPTDKAEPNDSADPTDAADSAEAKERQDSTDHAERDERSATTPQPWRGVTTGPTHSDVPSRAHASRDRSTPRPTTRVRHRILRARHKLAGSPRSRGDHSSTCRAGHDGGVPGVDPGVDEVRLADVAGGSAVDGLVLAVVSER
jgi:hypothetical protein